MGILGRGKSKSPQKQRVSNDYRAMPSSSIGVASSSRSPGGNSNVNAASTAGYQYAIRDYNNTADSDDANMKANNGKKIHGENQSRQGGMTSIPMTESLVSTATPFVSNSQFTAVPAASLVSNSRTNIINDGHAYPNGHANDHAGLPAAHDGNPDTIPGSNLTYSESQSPDKAGIHYQPRNPMMQQPQQRQEYSNSFHLQRAMPTQTPAQENYQEQRVNSSSTMDDYLESTSEDNGPSSPVSPASSSYSFPQYPGSPATFLHQRKNNSESSAYQYEPEMVDTTYSEHYGDAYTGKPIRYIYPQGYGSMRPRSRPWQIALIMFTVLAWLNVFIVGHCADRFDSQNYNDDKYQNVNDDDAIVIETRWCGSRNLYFTWVLSVALTGLSFAYCSIIGYVKARDFAVANGRSQPPGMVGRTDYYVQEEFGAGNNTYVRYGGGDGENEVEGGVNSYQHGTTGTKTKQTIYQADGTPRFFGGQIFKPTQAAVSLTSR